MIIPKKDRLNYWKKELIDELAVLMGGRCAEEIFTGDVSSGAQSDLERATELARNMVTKWGLSDRLGLVVYESGKGNKDADEEVRHLLNEAYSRSLIIVKEHRKQVELMAQMLVEFETLDSQDIKEIVNDTWNANEKRARLLMRQRT